MRMPDGSVRGLVGRIGMPALTENSHATPEALVRDLGLSRAGGNTVDVGGQEVGVSCFAVPVSDAPTLTAISVSGPAARITLKSATQVVPLRRRVARDLASEFDENAAL